MVYIVCGVSGSGKSTVGKMLADRLGLPFFDGDDFHPKANVEKMASGTPLNDEDRYGWLQTLATGIVKWDKSGGAVLACSALKEQYRELLAGNGSGTIHWIILEGDRELLLSRMQQRKGHFFDATMLDSQLKIYDRPEYGWVFDVASTPDEIVSEIIRRIAAE